MAESLTLEEIEKKYAALMKAQNLPMNYREYVSGTEVSHGEVGADIKNSALTSLAKNLSGYGTREEALGARGLSASGYSEYLKQKAIDAGRATVENEKKKERRAEEAAKRSYLDYLASYEKSQSSLSKSVVSALKSDKVLDAEKMYDYALKAGLSAEASKGLYDKVYTAVARDIKDNILRKIFENELSPAAAASYARAVGLNEEDVKAITDAADKYHRELSQYTEEFIDYLDGLGYTVNTK